MFTSSTKVLLSSKKTCLSQAPKVFTSSTNTFVAHVKCVGLQCDIVFKGKMIFFDRSFRNLQKRKVWNEVLGKTFKVRTDLGRIQKQGRDENTKQGYTTLE